MLTRLLIVCGLVWAWTPVLAASETSTPPPVEKGEILTLERVQTLVLVHHPLFRSLDFEFRARQAASLQAGLGPNPELDLLSEDFLAAKDFQTTLEISQPVLLGGKLQKQKTLAELSQQLFMWDYKKQQLAVLAFSTRQFIAVQTAQQDLLVARGLQEVAEKIRQIMARQVLAGKVSPLEEKQAQLRLGQAQLEVSQSIAVLREEKIGLAAFWGSTDPDFVLEGAWDEKMPADLPDETLVKLLEHHPELARWETELAVRQSAVELAQAQGIPDLALRGGIRYHHQSHDWGAVIGLGLSLPLWNQNQGNIQEAGLRLQQASQDREIARLRLLSELKQRMEQLKQSHATVQRLQTELLPLAEATFADVLRGYQAGKFPYLAVLESQRSLFELKHQYVTALGQYYQRYFEVAFLTGSNSVNNPTR